MTNVLILGATGFIGRNVLEALAVRDDLTITAHHHERPPFACEGVTWVQADLTQDSDVRRVCAGVDVIIQAAAVTSGAADIIHQPHIHITDNAVMNSLLFRAAHDAGVGHFIVFSCSILYRTSETPRREEDFDGEVHAPYLGGAWNKIYFEKMAEFFSGLGTTRYTVLRHSNMYGPHDKFDLGRAHMFGATVTKVMTAGTDEIVVWGDGSEGRDLLYVSDLAAAVEAAMDRQHAPFALFNIGAGEAVPVADVVRRIIAASGRDLRIAFDPEKPTIPVTISLDCAHAREGLGWTPAVDLDTGIAKTLEWYRDNHMSDAEPDPT